MAKKDELNFETDNKMASSEKLKALQAAMEKIENKPRLISGYSSYVKGPREKTASRGRMKG